MDISPDQDDEADYAYRLLREQWDQMTMLNKGDWQMIRGSRGIRDDLR